MSDEARSFAQALAWVEEDASRSRGQVTADWGQGRAAHGGLVGAIAMRQMLRRVPAARAPRSMTATFVGPLGVGEATCRTALLRDGKSSTLVEARIEQGAELCCVAQGVFAGPRPSQVELAHPPPRAIEAPEHYEPFPYVEGAMPAFLQHVRTRWAYGNFPFTGTPLSALGGYCELIGDERPDACSVVMLLDAWPTPAHSPLHTYSGASTVSWSIDFLADLSARPYRAPFRFEGSVAAAAAGHVQGDAWLWDADGAPLARARQLVALFG
jgi:acyl-CoA thioesterase